LGMLIANVPAVYMGERLAGKIPMRLVHSLSACIFAAIGLGIFIGHGEDLQKILRPSGQAPAALQAPP